MEIVERKKLRIELFASIILLTVIGGFVITYLVRGGA